MPNIKIMTRLLLIYYAVILLISCNKSPNENIDTGKIKNTVNKNSSVEINSSKSVYSNKLNNITDSVNPLIVKEPIRTINRIFDNYNKYKESNDSKTNLDSMRTALYQLKLMDDVTAKDLILVINVWMYYTVTDFPTKKLTEEVLFAHNQESIKAIEERMKNKYNWENKDGAPYSELDILLNRLQK